MSRAFVAFLCFCFAVPASAKLGEAVPQLVKRFGKSYTVELVPLGKKYKFRSANVSVDAIVGNGISICETYLSDHPLTASGEPPNDIVQAVLNTNVPKARWVEIEAAPFGADYALRSSDDKYIAILKYSGLQPENMLWTMIVGRANLIRSISTATPPRPAPIPLAAQTPTPTASAAAAVVAASAIPAPHINFSPEQLTPSPRPKIMRTWLFRPLSPFAGLAAVAGLAVAMWVLIVVPLWRFCRSRIPPRDRRKSPITVSQRTAPLLSRNKPVTRWLVGAAIVLSMFALGLWTFSDVVDRGAEKFSAVIRSFKFSESSSRTPSSLRFEDIKAKAESGDANSQYRLGVRYYNADGVAKDFSEAAKWYRKAAEQGLAVAQGALARCYFFGEGVAKDFGESVSWSRRAAEQNDPLGENLLGLSYSRGYGVTKDAAEAAKWFRKAADRGFAKAQFNLAGAFERGDGVVKDLGKATSWYRKAAEQNLAVAQYNLGLCYANGQGVAKDQVEAAKWYRKAAEQNLAVAQHNLGYAYYYGQGVAKDQVEAVKWYRKAAEQNLAVAQYNLGSAYYNGQGVAKDDVEAVKWLRKAAERNDPEAEVTLGDFYANGQGVAKDQVEAAKWYRKAAEQNLAMAQYNLGLCYSRGEGVAKDEVEAVKWFRKAAEQGYGLSQQILGLSYWLGRGVPKDYVEGYKWLLLAASQGNKSAKEIVSISENQMSREQIAEGQRLARDFRPREAPPSGGSMSNTEIAQTRPQFSGSGFFITDDGFLVTNEHVVKDGGQIRLVTSAGLIAAKVVKVDSANDLALLKAGGKFAPLPVIGSRTVRLGSTVVTVGFPNIGLQGFAPKFARGEISSLSGTQDDARYFQISVPVQPGNSGGALVDERGNVVGVVSAALSAKAALLTSGALPQNVNYAVKSSFLLGFLESVPEVAAKLKEPNAEDRKSAEVVEQAKEAAVLVLVY